MIRVLCCILPVILLSTLSYANDQNMYPTFNAQTQWTVVGAGPAGITSVGLLIELGIPENQITWIDPDFKVGRIGKYYPNVPANVMSKIFFEFLNACKTFRAYASAAIDELLNLDLEIEHPLEVVVKPLQIITDNLCQKVIKKQARLTALDFQDDLWHVGIEGEKFTTGHVILAVGAKPKVLDYPCEHQISLDCALDKSTLEKAVTIQDTVAVIGSAHSAILILKHLSEVAVGRVMNFYIHEPNFHHPEYGLGGMTAEWAKQVLLADPPANLLRIKNNPATLKAWMPLCNKIIYAVGFERVPLPPINGSTMITYNDSSGVIAPRLFGIGIAFPEKYIDEEGKLVSKIGLLNFMEYAQKVMPQWINTKDTCSRFTSFEELFTITAL